MKQTHLVAISDWAVFDQRKKWPHKKSLGSDFSIRQPSLIPLYEVRYFVLIWKGICSSMGLILHEWYRHVVPKKGGDAIPMWSSKCTYSGRSNRPYVWQRSSLFSVPFVLSLCYSDFIDVYGIGSSSRKRGLSNEGNMLFIWTFGHFIAWPDRP